MSEDDMNKVATLPARSAMPAIPPWFTDKNKVALVKRGPFRDCNDQEFDEAVAVATELNLNPLRKQIYAWVFHKTDEERRNMVLVVGIDGFRSIAARSGHYRPDNRGPRFTFKEELKNPDTNPLGLEKAEVSIFIHMFGEWHEAVGEAYWDEFAPIVKTADQDAYEFVETGEFWDKEKTRPKKKKRLKQGAQVRLQIDPKKEGWRKMARLMLAKCAESQAIRKAFPDDLSRVYGEEEIDRSRTLDDVDYRDVTPSEMAAQAEVEHRLDRIGMTKPGLTLSDKTGTLVSVPFGEFYDACLRMIHNEPPEAVASFMVRNRIVLQEFWAHDKNASLALKQILEARSAKPASAPASGGGDAASPGSNQSGSPTEPIGETSGEAASPAGEDEWVPNDKAVLMADEATEQETLQALLDWSKDNKQAIDSLPTERDRAYVRNAFGRRQAALNRA